MSHGLDSGEQQPARSQAGGSLSAASAARTPLMGAPDILSGDAGDVTDPWRRAKRGLGELAFEAIDRVAGTRRRARRLAIEVPSREVLVAGIYRPGSLLPSALAELRSARHRVTFALGAAGGPDPALGAATVASGLEGGKFENLNRVLAKASGSEPDWTLVIDDDVRLPYAFLDRFLGVCEAFDLDLAQPAQTLMSHSAWKVTRRRPASLVRETRFVEIGPVTAFGRRVASELIPFPELRYGWGLDLHWAALAAERGWRLGVVDALPVRHEHSPVATSYPRKDAEHEAQHFLADHAYLPSAAAAEVVATHRRARR